MFPEGLAAFQPDVAPVQPEVAVQPLEVEPPHLQPPHVAPEVAVQPLEVEPPHVQPYIDWPNGNYKTF